jgi:hypothetical protein
MSLKSSECCHVVPVTTPSASETQRVGKQHFIQIRDIASSLRRLNYIKRFPFHFHSHSNHNNMFMPTQRSEQSPQQKTHKRRHEGWTCTIAKCCCLQTGHQHAPQPSAPTRELVTHQPYKHHRTRCASRRRRSMSHVVRSNATLELVE